MKPVEQLPFCSVNKISHGCFSEEGIYCCGWNRRRRRQEGRQRRSNHRESNHDSDLQPSSRFPISDRFRPSWARTMRTHAVSLSWPGRPFRPWPMYDPSTGFPVLCWFLAPVWIILVIVLAPVWIVLGLRINENVRLLFNWGYHKTPLLKSRSCCSE